MVRKSMIAVLVVLALAALAAPAHAQSLTFSFNVGTFRIPTADRAPSDIIVTELNGSYINALDFDIRDFHNATYGGELLIGLGSNAEAGVGIGYYASTVPSVSKNYINRDGSEIRQTLRLRIAPLSATVRFLPLGKNAPVEPYVGAGLAVLFWRYTEEGQFVAEDESIFATSKPYAGSGNTVAPVVLGGLRVPFGRYSVGGEMRWQKAKGTLNTADFLSDTIDLGGFSYQVTFGVRF